MNLKVQQSTGSTPVGTPCVSTPSARKDIGRSSLPNGERTRHQREQLHDTSNLEEAAAAAVSEVRVQSEPKDVTNGLGPAGRETGGANAPAVPEQDEKSVDDPRNQDPSLCKRLRPACTRYPVPHLRMMERASAGQGLQPESPVTCTLGAGAHVPALQHHTVDLLHILRVRILTKYNAYR